MYLFKAILLFLIILLYSLRVCAQSPELSVQTGHTDVINDIKFSPDNSTFATASSDNTIILWDLKTGRQINILSGHNSGVNSIVFHPNQKSLYSVSSGGDLIIWNLEDGTVVKKVNIAPTPLTKVVLDPLENKLFIASKNIYSYSLDTEKREEFSYLSPELYTSLDVLPAKKMIAFGAENDYYFFVHDYSQNKQLKKYVNKTSSILFNKENGDVFTGNKTGTLNTWRPESKSTSARYAIKESFSKRKSNIYAIENSKNGFYVANKEKLVYCYNSEGMVRHILKGHTKNPRCLALSKDGSILLSAGEEMRVYVWNTESGKLITTIEGSTNYVSDIIYTKDGNNLIMAYKEGVIKKWDLKSNSFINFTLGSPKRDWKYNLLRIDSVSSDQVYLDAAFYANFKKTDIVREIVYYKIIWNTTSNTAQLNDYKKRKYGKEDNIVNVLNIDQTPVKKQNPTDKNSAMSRNESILVYDNKNINPIIRIDPEHKGGTSCFAFNPYYGYITSVGKDGILKSWTTGGKLISVMGAFEEKDFLFMNKDSYYYTSKGSLKNIGFRIQNKIFSFDQFDMKYNRPDLALQGLPFVDSLLLNSYKNAYTKRLKKSNLSENDLIVQKNVPALSLDLPSSLNTIDKAFEFTIRAVDSISPITNIFITINGVPIGSKTGESVETKKLDKKITLNLSPGENVVQVYVTNKNQVNSLKQSFKVVYKSKEQKPNLYIACIGAGHYDQKEFDLEYAEKDAKDVIELFSNSNLYGNVYTKILVNKSAKKDSLRSVRTFIEQADYNDVAIVFVAGHGILNKNLDYYLSTHDVDFANPEQKGISYDELDNILDNIRSRKKVLLIDACHSGEIDKEEVDIKTDTVSMKTDGKLSFRAAGTKIQKKGDMNLKSSFELSKVLFADMRLNNGTTVISSAGGAEYALESKEWKNGAFTFCFLKGLKKKKADLNSDGEILLSELQEYLSITVSELTNGKQVSTSRTENLQNDFRIW